MGRKKGKQRGHFSSKAQRCAAAAADQPLRTISSSWVDPRYGGSGQVSRPTSSTQKSQLQKLRDERGTVSLTQLRGLLRERRMEDTLEYREMRRRHMTRGTSGDATGGTEEGPNKCVKSAGGETARHDPGWLLYFDDCRRLEPNHDDTSSDFFSRQRQRPNVPSLQSLCVKALGPSLRAYTGAYGVDTMRSIVDTLPPEILTELSLSVSSSGGCGVDDELVTVLGKHNHVERLALYGSSTEKGRVTAAGIQSIVPQIISHRRQDGVDANTDTESDDAPDSWEDAEESLPVNVEGCTRIIRLELCNLRFPDIDHDDESDRKEKDLLYAVVKLLRLCPRITHLSISGSFDTYHYGSFLLQQIPKLLPRLRVLDLSHCTWMDDILLHVFLRGAVYGKKTWDNVELRMINVAGCPNVTTKAGEDWRRDLSLRSMDGATRSIFSTDVERLVYSTLGST